MKECTGSYSYTLSNTSIFSSERVTDPDPLNFLDFIKKNSAMLFLKVSGFLLLLALDITIVVELLF